jgi:serine/threonine-protein kinase SRPK3
MAALKVLVALLSDKEKNEKVWDELGMLKVIQESNAQSDGYRHVCQLLDNFTHQGPNGNHICLVLEIMKFNVLSLYRAYSRTMPFPLLARLSKQLLRALAYLHDECGIIHAGRFSSAASKFSFSEASSDIKGDNILVAGDPPESTITLDEDDLRHATFKLSDFGAGNPTARYDGKRLTSNLSCSEYDVKSRCGFDPT